MKRNKHSLSYYKLATFDMGKLVPVACFEVLPGDSVQQATSALLRVSPLLAPVMHPVSVRIHHWFVPHRLVWKGTSGIAWEEFITGGADGEGGSSGAYPVIDSGAGFTAGGLMDYLGVPPGVDVGEVSALPVRSYNLIFNEFYRDQDLVAERPVPTASGADVTSSLDVASIAWEKDYFTSARLFPQKGPDVTLPFGTSADLVYSHLGGAGAWRNSTTGALHTQDEAVKSSAGGDSLGITSGVPLDYDPRGTLTADLAGATAVNVNDVRRAFALQRYQEARSMYGSRYTEYLRYLGVRSSDARLQRPEYLGGGKQTISFTEVLQTSPTTDGDDTEGVGNLKGHGISAMRSRRYRRFFEEHGIVLSLMSVRPRTMYVNGVDRVWSRRTKEDYWQKELENIGQQEVLNKEIRGNHADPEGVFGYQDRYAEYRHIQSKVAGDFRSTLNYWHLARIFAADPALNSSFVTCDPSKRINAVQTEHVLWVMISNSIQARRMVSRGGLPGRIM